MELYYYLIIALVIFYIIYVIIQSQPKQTPSLHDYEKQKQLLKIEIAGLKKERESLISFDSNTRLTYTQSQVLDDYEHQGIKIPVDIIDDIVYMNIDDKERLYLFIENQRKNWKNEHMKRFTKKEVTR